jgi:hypothetical protein
METQAQHMSRSPLKNPTEIAIAERIEQIRSEIAKLPEDQQNAARLAGLNAMFEKVCQRVRCINRGENCEQIGGIDIGWF